MACRTIQHLLVSVSPVALLSQADPDFVFVNG